MNALQPDQPSEGVIARAELPAVLNQYSGDLICPLCESPLEITGYSDGFCARCMATVEIV